MRLIDGDALLEELNDKNVTTFSALIEEQRTVAFYVYCKVVEAIEKMPTIDAVPVWVSVKDRTPKMSGYYLVYINDEYMPCFKISYWMSTKRSWIGADVHTTITGVTHWTLLPKPPKEVSE